MYDRPETTAALDALWAGVRDHLGYGPRHLTRDLAYDAAWGREDLLLGQICNLPYRARHRDDVTVLGAGDHRLPDTPAGYYTSVFIVRAEDAPRGLAPAALGRFAYNDALSQSGWGAPLAALTARGLQFHTTLRTGAHADSMAAVATGRADLAAIDVVTWRMLERWDPLAAQVRVIGRTGLSPAQTFVTAKTNDPTPLRAALQAAIVGLSPDHAETLQLFGFATLPKSAYDIPLPPSPTGTCADTLQSAAI